MLRAIPSEVFFSCHNGALFTNMVKLWSYHWLVIIKYGIKLLIHSQTLMVQPLIFLDGFSNFILHFTGHVIIYVSSRDPCSPFY